MFFAFVACLAYLCQQENVTSMKRIIISCLVAFCLLPVLAQRRVGVLLPFQSAGALSQSMVEFYRGMLMAADSMRHQGKDIEIHAMDAGITEQSMRNTLLHSQLAEMDVIVGPAVDEQVEALADFCLQHQVQLLMPFNTPCANLHHNPYVFQCVAPQSVVYEDIVDVVMDKFVDAHFVLLQTNDANERGIAMQNSLRQKLDTMGFPYSMLNVNDDEGKVACAMNLARRNLVVADSPGQQAMQHCVNQLTSFLTNNPTYKVSLLGYPEWLDYAVAHATQFHTLDTYFFATYYDNPLSGRSIRFKKRYAEDFHQRHPSMRPSLSMLGHDLGLYAMGCTDAEPLQNTFHFCPVGEGGGSINHHVQIVHYATNNLIQIEK